jgi:hypothetical protein
LALPSCRVSCNHSLMEEPFFMEYQLQTISQKVQIRKIDSVIDSE